MMQFHYLFLFHENKATHGVTSDFVLMMQSFCTINLSDKKKENICKHPICRALILGPVFCFQFSDQYIYKVFKLICQYGKSSNKRPPSLNIFL